MISETISLADEAALAWFFGQGLSIYERSTFGAMLAKLDRDGSGSETCRTCGGEGTLDRGGFSVENKCRTCGGEGRVSRRWCDECKGLGKVEAYELQVESGGWCPICRGTGSVSVSEQRTPCRTCQAPNPRNLRIRLDFSRASRCSNCLGEAFEPVTVQLTQKAQDEAGVQADDAALTRFAITSRRVEKVRSKSPLLAEVLAVYYGDIGQRWALTDRGRLFSLYHLTGPGRKLARWGEKAGKGADLDLTPQERIGTQAALEAGQPKRERFALLLASGQAAVELYGRAARAWNRASSSKREQASWERLAGRLAELGHDELGEAVKQRAKGLQ